MTTSRKLLIGLALGLLAGSAAFAWRQKTRTAAAGSELRWTEDVGFVRGAKLRGFQAQDARATLDGHDIQKGEGVVVYWRRFGDDPAMDGEESFQMLTMELPELRPAKEYRVGAPGVRAFYSRGAAAGEPGWYTPEVQGSLYVSGVGPDSLTLSFNLKLPLFRSPGNSRIDGEILTFRRDLRCPRAATENLTPWLRGQSSYRR